MVEALFEVPTSGSQAQSTIQVASDLEDDQETPKPNKYQWKEDTRSIADSFTGDVSEPEHQFKSPHTLLHASQSRRTTKKTYAEAVYEGSGSEDEAEVKMRKKAAQQKSQERHKGVVEKAAPMVRSYRTRMIFVLIVSTLGNLRL
jgi:hypothetical protein